MIKKNNLWDWMSVNIFSTWGTKIKTRGSVIANLQALLVRPRVKCKLDIPTDKNQS